MLIFEAGELGIHAQTAKTHNISSVISTKLDVYFEQEGTYPHTNC